jgi:hypothetical protein
MNSRLLPFILVLALTGQFAFLDKLLSDTLPPGAAL